MNKAMKAEEETIFKVSEPRIASPLSSPDSESSFVDENDKFQPKVDSSLEESSEESTASSLKRRLRNLPSTSESSSFCERSAVVSSRLLQKERDFFYHIRELSNSIEEKDEAEVSSACSEPRISSAASSRLQNPRARRRAKMLQASKNQNVRYESKQSTDSERESVPVSSRASSLKVMTPKIENQENPEFSQNSSRCEDSSRGRLRFNQNDLQENGKSDRSNWTPLEETQRCLYRNDLKTQTTSPLSPSSPLHFSGTFPILNPNNKKPMKKMGGYRPASILLRNLSSESESDTGNDKILQDLMLERLKTKEDSIKRQSKIPIHINQSSSTERLRKLREQYFLSGKNTILNPTDNSARMNKNESKSLGDFEEIERKKRQEKHFSTNDPASSFSTPRNKINKYSNKSFLFIPNSDRNDSSKMENIEKFSPHLEKSHVSSGRSEIDFRDENPTFQIDKKMRVPDLKIRSEDSSPAISIKEKEDQQSRENALGDSGTFFTHSGNGQFQSSRTSRSENCFLSNTHSPTLRKISTIIPEMILTRSARLEKCVPHSESTQCFRQRPVSSTEKNSKFLASGIEKSGNDFLNIHPLEIANYENHDTLNNLFTSRTEYLKVKNSRDKKSSRSLENAYFNFPTLEKEKVDDEVRKKLSSGSILDPQSNFIKLNLDFEREESVFDVQEKLGNSGESQFEEMSSDAFSGKTSSTESLDQEKNDSYLKLVPKTLSKTSEQFLFESHLTPKMTHENQNTFISSTSSNENVKNRNSDRLFSEMTKENSEIVELKSEKKVLKKVQNRNEKEGISDDSLMFESCMGDSNQQDQRKWAFRREIGRKSSYEDAERYYHEPKKEEYLSQNLFESSAFFNSMKLAKSDSTAILSRKSSNHPNLVAKSSSSMSKLTCLLDSMKKETQDRFPFTISESTSHNSGKFKVENDQERIKENLPELEDESEEIFYKLDTHPSITRLALSGTEPLPSELISCLSYESPSIVRNFLPRLRGYVQRLSTRLKRKKRSKNSKSDPARILFKNSECRLESAGSSGDTMELQFLGEDIEDSKVSTKNSTEAQGDPKTGSKLMDESEKHDLSDFLDQRFDSETKSGRFIDVKSSRVKSSPVDIINPRKGFPRIGEPEPEDDDDFLFEEKANEIPVVPSPKDEVPSVDPIKLEVQNLPSQSRIESSNCFCFQMCRTLIQPSVASPGSVYRSSTRSKASKRKKP